MTTIATKAQSIVSEISNEGGKITTTSHQIAGHFNKRHDVVLRAILDLVKKLDRRYF